MLFLSFDLFIYEYYYKQANGCGFGALVSSQSQLQYAHQIFNAPNFLTERFLSI